MTDVSVCRNYDTAPNFFQNKYIGLTKADILNIHNTRFGHILLCNQLNLDIAVAPFLITRSHVPSWTVEDFSMPPKISAPPNFSDYAPNYSYE